jgi:hypothetical protein
VEVAEIQWIKAKDKSKKKKVRIGRGEREIGRRGEKKQSNSVVKKAQVLVLISLRPLDFSLCEL